MSLPPTGTLLRGMGALLLLALTVVPLAAQRAHSPPGTGFQSGPRVGIGYVVNAPSMFLGFNGYALTGQLGGLGIYVDAKLDFDSPRDEPGFTDAWTARFVEDEIGDQFFREEDEWRSLNVALIRPLSPDLMVYAGAGLAERNRYWEYVDQTRERGLFGYYWVRNEDESTSFVNVLGGLFFRIAPQFALQVGVESMPRGATVGASYSLPLR